MHIETGLFPLLAESPFPLPWGEIPCERRRISISGRGEKKWLERTPIEHALALLSDQTTFARDRMSSVTCGLNIHQRSHWTVCALSSWARLLVSDNNFIRHGYWIISDNWFQKPVYFVHDRGRRLHQTSFRVRAEPFSSRLTELTENETLPAGNWPIDIDSAI